MRLSRELAHYYMKRRTIPMDNLILVETTDRETCSRKDYEEGIASPIRAYFRKHDPEGLKYRCLALMYGLPLRVRAPEMTSLDQKISRELQGKRDSLRHRISKAEPNKDDLKRLRDEESKLKKQIDQVRKSNQGAAVDSELALVMEDSYSLEGWLPNRHFLGFRGKRLENMPQKVLMVSRLDGPSEEIVRRIIDDSLHVEKEGLSGTAYFDARWPDPGDKDVSGYALYDRSLHRTARTLDKIGRMPVKLDSGHELFQSGQCPQAALYCGWYSLARYVDAFTWVRGAVGFHIASSECSTLKESGSRVWCKMMLEKGVAATLGPVAEPYVESFPPPEIFFVLLARGRLTLAECYALSIPFWSWNMVLIGDPLYRPFKSRKSL
jgi:uncharacterized protein (TIGR03790 family)